MTGRTDAGALAATHAAAFGDDRPWSQAEIAALLDQAGTVLTGDAGCFVLGRVTLDEAEILTLATHPDLRRRGHARSALRRFEAAVTRLGARKIFLEVAEDNAAALALYLGAGYSEIGRRAGYYRRADRPAVAALVLEKPLLPA